MMPPYNHDILEQKVTDFLREYAIDEKSKNNIAPYVAKISLLQNHLYQDLGFKNRSEMGIFMKKYFPILSELKPKEKLWKKFIYDSIDEVAPSCEYCETKESCFACSISA